MNFYFNPANPGLTIFTLFMLLVGAAIQVAIIAAGVYFGMTWYDKSKKQN